jgi:hypothetical protein
MTTFINFDSNASQLKKPVSNNTKVKGKFRLCA